MGVTRGKADRFFSPLGVGAARIEFRPALLPPLAAAAPAAVAVVSATLGVAANLQARPHRLDGLLARRALRRGLALGGLNLQRDLLESQQQGLLKENHSLRWPPP